jgi:hypothetical protein
MEVKTKVIIFTIGLASDEESGVVVELPVQMLDTTAEKIVTEQDKCEMCLAEGAVNRLICAYAELLGYEAAYFVSAREMRQL